LISARRNGRPRNFCASWQATDLLSPEQKESLGRFLESCDLVKFAKYEPGEPELRELHGSAVRLVEETEPKEISNGSPIAEVRSPKSKNRKWQK
jgi:sugar/nucleoside kinase (ribokinase family)